MSIFNEQAKLTAPNMYTQENMPNLHAAMTDLFESLDDSEAGVLTYNLKLQRVDKAAKANARATKNEAYISVAMNLLKKGILDESAKGKILTTCSVREHFYKLHLYRLSTPIIIQALERLISEGYLKKVNIYAKEEYSAWRYKKGYQVI